MEAGLRQVTGRRTARLRKPAARDRGGPNLPFQGGPGASSLKTAAAVKGNHPRVVARFAVHRTPADGTRQRIITQVMSAWQAILSGRGRLPKISFTSRQGALSFR